MTTAYDSQDRKITIGAQCTVAGDTDIATVTWIDEDGEMVKVKHDETAELIESYHVNLI